MISALVLASLLSAPSGSNAAETAPAPVQPARVLEVETEPLLLRSARGRPVVVRAQTPPPQFPAYEEAAPGQPLMTLPPTNQATPWMPQPAWPGSSAAPGNWPAGPAPQASRFGANGSQPFRFGWQSRYDVGFLPGADADAPATGDLQIFETNVEWRYTAPLPTQWVMSIAPQFNLRLLEGPSFTPPAPPPPPPAGLPGDLYRLGLDLQLTTPSMGPVTAEFAFTPALATDFEHAYDSDAWQFDGRGALFFRTSPQWMFLLGAQYWDRLDDKIIPWVGAVFTPDDRWEIRAVFPNPEISVFIGTPWGVPQWLYVAGEYHIESYAFETTVGTQDKIELEDWRAVIGIRSESNGVSSFLEGGWVFGRDVDFSTAAGATPQFDLSSGFIARFGMRF